MVDGAESPRRERSTVVADAHIKRSVHPKLDEDLEVNPGPQGQVNPERMGHTNK
jgi:hypothetical protein